MPNLLPGARPVTESNARSEVGAIWGVNGSDIPSKPGRNHAEIIQAAINGELKALVIAGLDVLDAPDPQALGLAINSVDFVITLGIQENSLTRYANVSLPVAPVTEKSGTFTSTNALTDARVFAMIAESLGLDFGLQTIEELRQELSSFGSWNGNKLVKPTVATKDAAKTSVGNAILSTWNLLLDDGALQKGEEHLAGTQRPVVAHMSEKTATDNKLENEEKVIISNSRGSITIKLEIIEMVNDVVWIPSNNHDSKVKSKLGAKEGDVVTIKKGSF